MARGAPADPLADQGRAWAEERCRRTSEHSASLDGLLADFRARAGAERVDVRMFESAMAALGGGVRVFGPSVVAGMVLR